MQKATILAIGAHPDDIEFGCGGTLIKYTERGHRLFLYIMTEGGLGAETSTRVEEQMASKAILGAEDIFSVKEALWGGEFWTDGYFINTVGKKGNETVIQKYIQSQGMDRGDLKDIDGFFAVLLWDEYQRTGDQRALDTLLAYNIQDTINLEDLMVTAYNMKLKQTPFYESLAIADSPAPLVNPHRVDLNTVDRLKNSPHYWASRQWH
jgi:hypothetical protein